MKGCMQNTLRIRDWEQLYENSKTRALKRLTWVPVPNRHDGDGYNQLVEHPNGAAYLGAWVAIIQVASKCDPRGTLIRDGGSPHTADSISRMSRLPAAILDEAIERLLSIGWLEAVQVNEIAIPDNSPSEPNVIPSRADVLPPLKGMEWKEGKGLEQTDGRAPLSDNPFEEFKRAYPESKRTIRIEPSCRAYVGRISGVPGEHRRLMDGLKRHIGSDQWARSIRDDGGRFVPSMEKFITDGMYLDTPPQFKPDQQLDDLRSALAQSMQRKEDS